MQVVIAWVLALIEVKLPALRPCRKFGWWVGIATQVVQIPAYAIRALNGTKFLQHTTAVIADGHIDFEGFSEHVRPSVAFEQRFAAIPVLQGRVKVNTLSIRPSEYAARMLHLTCSLTS